MKTQCDRIFFNCCSHMSTIGRWWCIYPTFTFFYIIQRWFITYVAFEHLFVGLPKIFREECVYNRIHWRIAVSQAVCCYSEEKWGLSQWENSKFSPEVDHMMWQPRYSKNHHHHQHSLGCLSQEKKNIDDLLTLEQTVSTTCFKTIIYRYKNIRKKHISKYLQTILVYQPYAFYFT